MATFYVNPNSKESIADQWVHYLQNVSYIGDIRQIVESNRKHLQNTFIGASTDQVKAMKKICGSIDEGFQVLNRHLVDIKFEIKQVQSEICVLTSMLDWKLSQLIEEQRLTNQLLGHIASLLRIPDSQKQRIYFIEQGLKYYKGALLEGPASSFYEDALTSFKEAEKIERKDYITLNRIGQVYLYSKHFSDFELAEEYFIKSAREAYIEAVAGGTNVSQNLTPVGLLKDSNPFWTAYSEANLFAARCCYLQRKLPQAISLAKEAYSKSPNLFQAAFEEAKYLGANNEDEKAVRVLETIIRKDRFYVFKALEERDLNTKPRILQFLTEELPAKTISEAKSLMEECKSLMSTDSSARTLMVEIENNISKDNFISGMEALDLLNADHKLFYDNYTKDRYEYSRVIYHNKVAPYPIKLLAHIKRENDVPLHLEKLKNEIESNQRKLRKDEGWKIFLFLGIGFLGIGYLIGLVIGCTMNNLSVDKCNQSTILFCTIGFTVFGIIFSWVLIQSNFPLEPEFREGTSAD